MAASGSCPCALCTLSQARSCSRLALLPRPGWRLMYIRWYFMLPTHHEGLTCHHAIDIERALRMGIPWFRRLQQPCCLRNPYPTWLIPKPHTLPVLNTVYHILFHTKIYSILYVVQSKPLVCSYLLIYLSEYERGVGRRFDEVVIQKPALASQSRRDALKLGLAVSDSQSIKV